MKLYKVLISEQTIVGNRLHLVYIYAEDEKEVETIVDRDRPFFEIRLITEIKLERGIIDFT